MRKTILILWLVFLFSGIAALFWQNELVYALPTPVPQNYQSKMGQVIDIAAKTSIETTKPLFLHFFNPSCPCSRFNMPYFRSLVKDYKSKAFFAVVVLAKDANYTADGIRKKFDLDIPVFFDNSIATDCGVYSTPQAVIINTDKTLFYRGNYNKNRYCVDKKTNYAQMALDSLLINDQQTPVFDPAALKSYGCQLPLNCRKQ